MIATALKLSVKTFRDAGLEAKWGKARYGRPSMFVRNPKATSKHQRETWWIVDKTMWNLMNEHGVLDGFDSATALGGFFSVPA